MGKETVHIISHSHWDREWYLPLEEHRMRLVELFDDLFDLFETDPEFRSFHLDGQTIVLDDYLEIRPQNRELLKKYIQDGRLIIGPFTSCRMITSSPARPICEIPFWVIWKARSGDGLRRLVIIQILSAIWDRLLSYCVRLV